MAYLCVYCLTSSGAVSLWQRTGSQGNASGSQQEIGSFRFACPARPIPCFCLSLLVSRILCQPSPGGPLAYKNTFWHISVFSTAYCFGAVRYCAMPVGKLTRAAPWRVEAPLG